MNKPKYASVNLSDIAPLTPINRSALGVITHGEEYEFVPTPGMLHSRTPLPWRLATEEELEKPSWVELFGEQLGRLSVVGIYPHKKSPVRWVVKCVCGIYEVRSAAYIKACLEGNNPGEDEPMCAWCTRTNSIFRGYGKKVKPRW